MTADTRIADFITYRNVCVALFPTCLKPYPIITENSGSASYLGYNVAGIPQYNVPPGFDMAENQITYTTGFHEPGHEFDDYLTHQDPTSPHHANFLKFFGITQTWDAMVAANTPYNWFNDPGEMWADAYADAIAGQIKQILRHTALTQATVDVKGLLAFFLSQVPAAHVPTSTPVPTPPAPTPEPPSVLMGADISNWQGALVDFAQMKTQIQFVIIKATEGIGFKDPEFDRNWSESQRVGLVRGAYHFAHPELNDPVAEADYFTNVVTFETGDLVWLDWETQIPAGFDIVQWCLKWLDRVKQNTEIVSTIYLNQSEVDGHDWRPVIDAGYSLALADYEDPLNATPWPVVAFRQYTSHGAVPGVAGPADLDIFYGDLTALAKYGKAGTTEMTDTQLQELLDKINGVAQSIAEYLWRFQHGLDVKTGDPLK